MSEPNFSAELVSRRMLLGAGAGAVLLANSKTFAAVPSVGTDYAQGPGPANNGIVSGVQTELC
jgi:hypothetical protein